MDSSPIDRQKTARDLVSARQTIDLLKSQLRANMVEKDYWEARLSEMGTLLDTLIEDHSASNQQGRLAALYEVSKVIGSSLELAKVLDQVMDAIIKLTGAERGFLLLFDQEGELEVKAARNVDKETLKEAEEFAISRSVIQVVADTGEQVVTTNATEDPRFAAQASVVAHSLRSIQCVPLRARGKTIGVVYVDNRIRSGVFDEADLDMLSAFATQAAIAIENARLFTMTDEALAARVKELSTMQEINRQLNETLNFNKVMGLTLDWAVKVTKASDGIIGLIDLEEGQTKIIAQHGEAPEHIEALVEGTREPTTISGLLTVPLQREGRIIGVIALNRRDGTNFERDDLDFVSRLADHAVISIENARLYEAVQKANQAKTEFVSVMTHELRLPMTSIKGYAEMLEMTGELTEKQVRFIDIIQGSVQRMSILISDLSDISRIESGRLKVDIEKSVDFKALVKEALSPLQAEIDRREHKLVVDIPDDLPAVKADSQRLQQILTNLVSNAYKYTPNGGTITVQTKSDNQTVTCMVKDTGIGMTEEEVKKLFNKFWRSEEGYVRDQPGTGLGLAIAKNLIEMQGGEMSVESKKGAGTTFSFTIPICPEEKK
jgi:signal transduction histidine kinase